MLLFRGVLSLAKDLSLNVFLVASSEFPLVGPVFLGHSNPKVNVGRTFETEAFSHRSEKMKRAGSLVEIP